MSSPPDFLVLQWHVTERCNRRCTHCYQDAPSAEELQFQDLLNVVDQFKVLLDQLSADRKLSPVRGQINITGGEPFIRHDFLDLLDVFYSNIERFSFAVFTNGSYIDEPMAVRLRKLRPVFIQVSMEGAKETNDAIRGSGAFEQTASALKHLVKQRIRTLISFTAHQNNFREFPEVARLGRDLGVSRVWADRLIPWGTGSGLSEKVLTPEATQDFFEIMYRAHGEAMSSFSRTEISMHRALQFLVAGGRPYQCGAGNTLITVMPNGDLYPCRRMPIHVGNLMETPLVELYYKSKLLNNMRDREIISYGCEECSFFKQCRGGLKCLSYALTGTPFKADPGCWIARPARKHKSHYLNTCNDLITNRKN